MNFHFVFSKKCHRKISTQCEKKGIILHLKQLMKLNVLSINDVSRKTSKSIQVQTKSLVSQMFRHFVASTLEKDT